MNYYLELIIMPMALLTLGLALWGYLRLRKLEKQTECPHQWRQFRICDWCELREREVKKR